MNPVRETILARLAASPAPLSGHVLAKEMGLSRAAIWKHIQCLRRQGICIDALSGRGYALKSEVISAAVLESRLQTQRLGHPCLVLEEVDSTNSEALRHAEQQAAEGLTVIARRQRQGRGRMGRDWHTLPDEALAMSVLLRPQLTPELVPQLSLVAAAAVHEALSSFAHDVRIKWPNDILHDGAKLAGILTEMRAEPGCVHAVIIGIGVNVRPPKSGWPENIDQPATDLSTAAGKDISRLDVAIALLRCLEHAYFTYLEHGFAPLAKRWWQAHAANGRRVRVHDGRDYIHGVAEALDKDGALLLRTEKGLQRIIAGDLELLG